MPLPHYRDQAEAFGILHFMEKPADAKTLGALVREQWDKWKGVENGSGGFSALLTQLTTLDVIQLKCLARSTVALPAPTFWSYGYPSGGDLGGVGGSPGIAPPEEAPAMGGASGS